MKGFALIGFRSDQGVVRNRGRAGASEGPVAIRQACVNFACHFDRELVKLFDCGDVVSEGTGLSAAQNMLAEKIQMIIDNDYFPVILGGGHEVSLGGYKGLFATNKFKDESVGILNFDSHFDLRIYKDHGNSGTPFLQIADLCKVNQKDFHYMCLGIQTQSNTEALFRRANELNVSYILAEDFNEQNIANVEFALENFLKRSGYTYLTIDMDVFDVSNAPGVSAPAVVGIDKHFMIKMLRKVMTSGSIVSCDIAETNPKYDTDGQTAKLAAYLVYMMVG
jgi:formiminoglutamase